jgi:hypothetical protein
MSLTDEQITTFRQKLNFAVKYRETYDEVYDHVLSRLDDRNDGSDADQIIEREFGGYENLNTTEKYRAGFISTAMRRKHWQNMKSFFNWPTVAFTTIIVLAGCWIQVHSADKRYLLVFTMVLSATPLLFIAFKKLMDKYRAWHSDSYKKSSIKDGYIFTAALFSCNVVNLFSYIIRHVDQYDVLTLIVFVFYIIYVLSFFRLYREEYKMNIAR